MSVVPNDTNLKSNKGHFPIEPQLSGSFVPDSESLLTGIHDNPALSDESQSFHSLPSHDNSPSTSPSKGGSPDLPEPHGGHILDSAPSDMNLEPQPDHTVAYTRFPVAYPGLPPGFIPEFISWVTPPQQYLGQYGEIMPPTPFIPSSQLEPSGGSVFHPSILPPQPPPVIPVMEHIPERGWQMVRFASPLIQMASPLSTSATTSVSSRESSGDSIPHYIPTSPVNLYSHTVNQGSTTSLSSSQSSQSSPAFVSPTFAYVKQTPGMTPPYPLKYPPQPVLDSTSALPNPELVYPPGIGPGYAAYTSEPTLSTRQPELLKTGAGISAEAHVDNNEKQYPEDALGSECSPMARVWQMFIDQCQSFDAERINGLRENVDVLLVFAGLFSAVVATFVVQTSQNLQTDYSQVSASLLFEMVSIQRAIASGISVSTVPASLLNPESHFIPATSDRWVNGLWFVSLSLSLLTALVAVLAKQWIRQHVLPSSGTLRDRCRIRQFRFIGFETWHVPLIVGILPFLLHISLALFLTGLVIFLMTVDHIIAYVILAITGSSYTLYLIALFMPIFFPQCPYRTSLTAVSYTIYQKILQWISAAGSKLPSPSMWQWELKTIVNQSNSLDIQSLQWLYTMSSDPTVHHWIIQCIGGLQTDITSKELITLFENTDLMEKEWELLQDCLSYHLHHQPFTSSGITPKELERLLCSHLCLYGNEQWNTTEHTSSLFLALPVTDISSSPSEVVALNAIIACQNDSIHTSDSITGADIFMHLLQQSKQSVLLHPFIWISLFEDVAAKQIPVIPNISIHNSTYEQFFHAFLKLIAQEGLLWNTRSLQDDGTHRMNLQDALHFGLYNHIETHLLKILVDFDVYKKNTEISGHIRLLLSIITYILSTDSFQTVDHEEQPEHSSEIYYCKHCLAILIFAVQDLRICIKDNTLISAPECTAISTIISKIITSSCFINEQKPQSRKLWKIRSDVIHMLLQMDSVSLISTSGLHMYTLPLKWRDIIYPLVFEVRETKGWKRHNMYILARCVINTETLLMNDMNGEDTTAALATFINLNLLDIARHTMYIYPWSNLLQAYISAVWRLQGKTKRANPDAEVHINYIHHPPNLFSICAIVGGQLAGCSTGQEERKNIDMTLKKLASLCPHNTTWPTCLWVVNRLSKDEIYLSNKEYLDIDIKHKQAQQRPYKPNEVKAIMDHLQHSVVILREHVTEPPDSSFQPLSHFIIDSNSVGEQSNV